MFEVWAEARDIWTPGTNDIGDRVKCLVSIGTGDPGMLPLADGAWAFASKTLAAIATETEKTAERFHQEHNEMYTGKPDLPFQRGSRSSGHWSGGISKRGPDINRNKPLYGVTTSCQ